MFFSHSLPFFAPSHLRRPPKRTNTLHSTHVRMSAQPVAKIDAVLDQWQHSRHNLQEILPRNISAGHQHRREARDCSSEVDGIHLQSKDTQYVKT